MWVSTEDTLVWKITEVLLSVFQFPKKHWGMSKFDKDDDDHDDEFHHDEGFWVRPTTSAKALGWIHSEQQGNFWEFRITSDKCKIPAEEHTNTFKEERKESKTVPKIRILFGRSWCSLHDEEPFQDLFGWNKVWRSKLFFNSSFAPSWRNGVSKRPQNRSL